MISLRSREITNRPLKELEDGGSVRIPHGGSLHLRGLPSQLRVPSGGSGDGFVGPHSHRPSHEDQGARGLCLRGHSHRVHPSVGRCCGRWHHGRSLRLSRPLVVRAFAAFVKIGQARGLAQFCCKDTAFCKLQEQVAV